MAFSQIECFINANFYDAYYNVMKAQMHAIFLNNNSANQCFVNFLFKNFNDVARIMLIDMGVKAYFRKFYF